MSDTAWVATYVEQVTAWLEQANDGLPVVPRVGRIAWQRDGLYGIWDRLETLKDCAAQTAPVAEEIQKLLGSTRAALREIQGQHDDLVGAGIEAQVSNMAARGMAADERRIAHDTKALPLTIARRRLERLIDLLDGYRQAVNHRLFTIRDEREDLRIQVRAINVGIEIGEL